MVLVSQPDLIAGAIAGRVVSFPTDTVPALAVKPNLANQIFQLKQRPSNKPLILLGASIDDLLPYVTYSDAELAIWQDLIHKHLPGALTLVLPASSKVPTAVNPTDSANVGIRIPQSAIAQEILQQTGVLATSSANLSGQSNLVTTNEIEMAFPSILVLNQVNLPLNSPLGSGLPSTVIRRQNGTWQILRQGSITI